jgi:hypothetical protein
LEVSDSQVLGAAASLAMLSPVGENVGKYELSDIPHKPAPRGFLLVNHLQELYN